MNFYRCIEFVGQIRTQMSDHRPFICHLRFLFSIWKIETRCARFRYAVHDALQCDSAGYSNRHSNDAAISCLEIVINLDFTLDASHIFLYQNQTCFAAMRREFFLSHDSFFSRPCTWNKAINSAMRCLCVLSPHLDANRHDRHEAKNVLDVHERRYYWQILIIIYNLYWVMAA